MPVLERTMKTMRLADDVVTFSTFRKTMSECFNRNSRTRRPLLITHDTLSTLALTKHRQLYAMKSADAAIEEPWE